MVDYSKICFVVMPFGIKKVKTKIIKKNYQKLFSLLNLKKDERETTIDFDYIYNSIFVPAVESVKLPEGGFLKAKRTDQDFFSADIGQEMFQYLEYSRIVLTDITGLNANVFYELGIRHHARPIGTAIFRLLDAPIPFDINHIKAFPYRYDPKEYIEESKSLITSVLSQTLEYNRLDSPVQIALKAQQGNSIFDGLLREAENALRNNDNNKALEIYSNALSFESNNILLKMKLGIIYKSIGEWEKALELFNQICYTSADFYEAHKEKGIAENKLHNLDPMEYRTTGEDSLTRAISLNNIDFDAMSSLGGVLKREGRYQEALEMYRKSVEISKGHPYPLLNAIKINAKISNCISIDDVTEFYLRRAKIFLENQVGNIPPYNTPWSYFDLSEIYLFLEHDEDNFIKYVKEGINYCHTSWEIDTFMESFKLIESIRDKPSCFSEAIELLTKYKDLL